MSIFCLFECPATYRPVQNGKSKGFRSWQGSVLIGHGQRLCHSQPGHQFCLSRFSCRTHLAQSYRHSDAAKIVIGVASSGAPDVAASIIQPIANKANAAVIASDIASPQPEPLLRPAPPARIVRKL